MKVLIAAAAFPSEMSGVQRHALNVARSLLLREETDVVHLAFAPWQQKLTRDLASDFGERFVVHAPSMSVSSMARNIWYYRHLPILANRLGADVVHLAYPVPTNARAFHCPVAVTLHDMYPYEIPENFGFPKVLVNRIILRQCLDAVDGIACVSIATQKRARQYLSVRLEEKMACIPNCVLPMPKPVRPVAINWRNAPFLLVVAQHRKNKNIPLILRCFARLVREQKIDAKMQLLLIGIPGPETLRIRETVAELALSEHVCCLSGLSEAELHWCYANSDALLMPSSTEGFGLPVAEGLLVGCRVVCSDIEAHREIDTEHCHFMKLDGDAETALSKAIVQALGEPAPGPVHLPQLSTEAVGTQYLRFYRTLLEAQSIASRRDLGVAVRRT